jgi:hypothetical protein
MPVTAVSTNPTDIKASQIQRTVLTLGLVLKSFPVTPAIHFRFKNKWKNNGINMPIPRISCQTEPVGSYVIRASHGRHKNIDG